MSKVRYDAMLVTKYKKNDGSEGSYWVKIGAAFQNKDGSIGVKLDAIPVHGDLVLQIPMSKEEKEEKFGKRGSGRGGGGSLLGYPKEFDDHDDRGGGGGFADEG